MTVQENILYKDAYELLRLYHHPPYPEFRSDFQHPRAVFRGKPVKFYIRLFLNLAPLTKTRQNLTPFMAGGYKSENIDHLFTRFYENMETRELLHRAALGHLGVLTTTAGDEYVELHRKLEDPNLSREEREKLVEKFSDKHLKKGKEKDSEKVTSEPTQTEKAKHFTDRTAPQAAIEPLIAPVVNLAPKEVTPSPEQRAFLVFNKLNLGIPGLARDLFSKGLITARNLILNAPKSLWIGAAIGAAGGFLGGAGIIGIAGGLIAGGMFGALIPSGTNVIRYIIPGATPEAEEEFEEYPESSYQNQSSSGYNQSFNPPTNSFLRRLNLRPLRSAEKSLARKGVESAGGKLAKAGASNAARAAVAAGGWEVWAVIGIIILVLLLIFFFFLNLPKIQSILSQWRGQTSNLTNPPNITSQIKVSKTGDSQVENGQDINYVISVIYTGTGTADLEVVDQLPTQVAYKEASDNPTVSSNGQLTWELTDVAANQQKQFYLTVSTIDPNTGSVISPDSYAINKVNVTVLKSSPVSTGTTPTQDNCAGIYNLDNPVGNFGDPNCNFKRDDLYNLLKANEDSPVTALFWYDVVVRCESSYNPNAWASPSTGTPDPVGAWGLFQMGRGRNGQYDHGDVPWQLQTTNAINYNHSIGNSFSYWQGAQGC